MKSHKAPALLMAALAALNMCACGFDANKSLDRADRYFSQGSYEKALTLYTKVIDHTPSEPLAYIGSCRAYAALDDTDSALDVLQRGYEATGSGLIAEEMRQYTAVDLSGVDVDDMQSLCAFLDGAGVKYVIRQQYSDTVPEGGLISANLPEDGVIMQSTVVSLTQSLGTPKTLVADFVSMDIVTAKKRASDMGLDVEEKLIFDSEEEYGSILSQSVRKDSAVPVGTKIVFSVSAGSRNHIVKDIRGLTLKDARRLLRRDGVPYKIRKQMDAKAPYGTVIDQSLTPGDTFGENSLMIVTVCAGDPNSNAVQVLNSADLAPQKSGYKILDDIVEETLDKITDKSMSTYEKVKACYDYLINTCDYGSNQMRLEYADDARNGRDYEVRAWAMLKGHIGTCYDYSDAFCALTRRIGLDCRVVDGGTHAAAGGFCYHLWCEMTINGTVYVFDPQVEDHITTDGNIRYERFCKTYESIPGKYVLYDENGVPLPGFEYEGAESVFATDEPEDVDVEPENDEYLEEELWEDTEPFADDEEETQEQEDDLTEALAEEVTVTEESVMEVAEETTVTEPETEESLQSEETSVSETEQREESRYVPAATGTAPVTTAAVTEPAVTEPAVTEPAVTEPAAGEPEPDVTQAPAPQTEAAVTAVPEVNAPAPDAPAPQEQI